MNVLLITFLSKVIEWKCMPHLPFLLGIDHVYKHKNNSKSVQFEIQIV